MSNIPDQNLAVVDAFTRLITDVTRAPTDADAKRLRSVVASALRVQLRNNPSVEALPTILTHLHQIVSESARTQMIQELNEVTPPGGPVKEAILVVRRDAQEVVLSGQLVDDHTALVPGERLGPFQTVGGMEVWFDVFFAAHRIELKEIGVSAPTIVFTQALSPIINPSSTTIDIESGTVWIRGDLIDGSLPASTFVGIKVQSGSLKLDQSATVSGQVVEISTPLKGVLQLDLAPDNVTAVPGACSSSGAVVVLPESLKFTFNSGSMTVEGTIGKAEVWNQKFDFGPSGGRWTFVERLWTVVLEYEVNPTEFDAEQIEDDLAHFTGKGAVKSAGLGLPVVVAANPAILGETAYSASWLLLVENLNARWYSTDPRLHGLLEAWIGISSFGAIFATKGIVPFAPPVTHAYDLWTIGGGSDKRLSWHQSYKDSFSLFYRCHVVEGEHLMVQGEAEVTLDRPVTTNGVPVRTPITKGVVLLHRFNGTVTAMLGGTIADEPATNQFALRNALVWTRMPSYIFVSGELLLLQRIDAGNTQLLFGVYGWAPSLPDPYVSNVFISRPEFRHGVPRSSVLGVVSWTTPDSVTVSFQGLLGTRVAVAKRDISIGDPRPIRTSDDGLNIGLTQQEQDRLFFNQQTEIQWIAARKKEEEERNRRFRVAQNENKKTISMIDRYLSELVGPTPNIMLLDVSTNLDLLGVAIRGRMGIDDNTPNGSSFEFQVSSLAVHSQVSNMRVVTLPQVQWEPVRTLDEDQNIMTMGWFPTPLASASDGGQTQIGVRSQKLMPVIPDDALQGTFDAFRDGTPVGIRTTFPFGLIGAIQLQPQDSPQRKADLYALTRPKFPDEGSVGGIQVTAIAESARPDDGGISPMFQGQMRQLLNGVELATGIPLGISVLGETLQPAGSVETIFNNDMTSRPRVPVTRIDLSGYGGSNFSDWNNPFAAFAEAAKVQFRLMIGRTVLEVIKINSVLHPWGIRVTRSVTIERRPGGGVIRRDSGWQAFTPGMFDYRYYDTVLSSIVVAPYTFDAGMFRGLFNVRTIRPAPGRIFVHGAAKLVPYYFDADVAIEGVNGLTVATGILGYLQTEPNGLPAGADAIQALIETQGPIGGPIEAWMNFGNSGLPFRAQRIEVGLAMDGSTPVFVTTVRGIPRLPTTGAWSVVVRPVVSIPVNGGEAVPVAENRGVPFIRRYPIQYPADDSVFSEPPLSGSPGDYRFADAADLFTPTSPENDYALMQSTPTHAFLFPRPFAPSAVTSRIESGYKTALADIFARSTSKGAFPPAGNTIEMSPGSLHFKVGPSGKLALSSPISIVGHTTPLRVAGISGHGSSLFYNSATLKLELEEDRWEAEFTGLQMWSDILGLEKISGSEMRIVGSTDQRPQIAELKTLILQEVEEILQYIPIFGARGVQGPIDLGASNAKHELKVDVALKVNVPPPLLKKLIPFGEDINLTLSVGQSTGIDIKKGGPKTSATFSAELEGKFGKPYFVIVSGEITFSLTSVSGELSEELNLKAFVGVGVRGNIGPFEASAFLGVGFILVYDASTSQTKYGGLVALEAEVNLKIVKVKIRAELQGLVYNEAGTTKCDYSGSVKIQVDIFLIFSISATYQVTETKEF